MILNTVYMLITQLPTHRSNSLLDLSVWILNVACPKFHSSPCQLQNWMVKSILSCCKNRFTLPFLSHLSLTPSHPGHLVLFYFQNNLWNFNAFLLLSSLAEITKLAYNLVSLLLSLYPYFHWFIPSIEENGPIKTETKEHSSPQSADILSYFRQHKSYHPQRDLQCPKWYDFLPPPCFSLWVNF